MQSKKIIYLFLGLVLPVLIFLFLRMFGRNEFDVPLLYDKGVPDPPEDCQMQYNTPYVINDTVMNELARERKQLLLINFSDSPSRLRKIASGFDKEVTLMDKPQLTLDSARSKFIQSCVLMVRSADSVVMVDNKNQIRGYYDISDRDELDRLEAELNIILKKY